MKILSAVVLTFLYLEIFPQQTTGQNYVFYHCEDSSSDCYTISDEKANWDTANATCVQQGGEIIYDISYRQYEIIHANNGGEIYWTGYRRLDNTSVFQSTDGSTFSYPYYYWKENNPKADIDCVAFDGDRVKFLSSECNSNYTVVCMIDYEECNDRVQEYRDICSSSALSSGIPTENSLRNLTLNFSLTTGDTINFRDNALEIIITKLRVNTQTQILIDHNTIQIGTDTFQEDTTLVIHSTEYTVQFNNAFFILRSEIVTIYASNNSTGNLNIFFRDFNYADYGKYMCVYLSSDGNISVEGLTTQYYKSERGVQCTTNIHGKITVGVYEIFETDFRNLFEGNSLNYVEYNCRSSYPYCFTISDEKANWDTGYAACAQLGGKSNDYIYSRINNIIPTINGGEFYWTGWRRVGSTPVFLSTDGDTFSYPYYYWKDNNPIAGIDCVGYDGESRKLLSLECDTNNTVVCEIGSETCNDRVQQYKDICSSSALSSGIPTENSLRNLTLNFSLTTGDIIHFRDNAQDLIITQLRANTQTQIPIDDFSTIQIGTDTFQEGITVAIHKTQKDEQITNTPFTKRRDIITIYSSSDSSVTVKIAFKYYYYGNERCVYQRPDGDWSTDGVGIIYCRLNRTIQCTTELQTMKTIALERNFYSGGHDSNEYDSKLTTLYIVLSILAFILLISLFLLLSSVVIFVVSGEKFFSHDINILHFNNTLSLFLAIISLPAIYPGVNTGVYPLLYSVVYKPTQECFAISFFLQFLWTNVFLSSLSIAIVVFYTIWIVSINHIARKLYKYLIPIGWGVSLLWSVASTVIKTLTASTCDSKIVCLVDSNFKFDFDWPFLGPMVVILLINTTLLILSLVKIWVVLRKQNSQEGELKRLRRVAIGGILLIPSLGLPFISLIAIQLIEGPVYGDSVTILNYLLTIFIILLINAPIGIVHFIIITCQIKETILRKCCCCYCVVSPAQNDNSINLNVASNRTDQETPNDVIPDSVSNTEPARFSTILLNF